MKTLQTAFGLLLSLTFATAQAGDKDTPAPALMVVDIGGNPKPERTFIVKKGDVIQFTVIRNVKEDLLKTLRVELSTDSIAVLTIVQVEVKRYSKNSGAPLTDPTKRNLSCFVQVVKDGPSPTIKITPVGADGKDRPALECVIQIGPKNPKKADPSQK